MVALLSPVTIVFWMSVFGGYYAEATARGSRTPPVLLVSVLLLGASAWSACAALLIHFGRRALQGPWYTALVTVLSVVLLAFAGRLMATGVMALAHAGSVGRIP
jgi:threonine/homoserine/homoserine lactone efflux protein